MYKIKSLPISQIVTPKLSQGAIIRTDFPGFKEDYLVIHCLIRKYKPKSFMEIGTSSGMGTRVICNAMPNCSKVYSLDVPPGTDPSIIYPKKEDKHPGVAGKYCELPYEQLYGDCRNFDFKNYYPLEAWFIDGKHNFVFAKNDSQKAIHAKAKLIIWHDSQIPGIRRAVSTISNKNPNYEVFSVANTRIMFAIRK